MCFNIFVVSITQLLICLKGRRGRDCMVVGFIVYSFPDHCLSFSPFSSCSSTIVCSVLNRFNTLVSSLCSQKVNLHYEMVYVLILQQFTLWTGVCFDITTLYIMNWCMF
jgi:hypothetical protein